MSAPLRFVSPPLGFEPLVDFSLDDIEGAQGLYALKSVSADDVRLFVIDAALHLPLYSPTISDEQSESIGLVHAGEAAVLVVVNPSDDQTTVNLMAPIVVNTKTGQCHQFILEDQGWPLRAPLRPPVGSAA